MGRFFNDKVKTRRKTRNNYIIIGASVGGGLFFLIILIIVIKAAAYHPDYALRQHITIDIATKKPTQKMYFSRNNNVKDKDISIDDSKLDVNTVGSYPVVITVKGTAKKVTVEVEDKEPPVLKLESLSIFEGETYEIKNFVLSCSDNSNQGCIYDYHFRQGVRYDNISEIGSHLIEITAKDYSGNEVTEQTILTVMKKFETPSQVIEGEMPQ